jgi:hypothetical protein
VIILPPVRYRQLPVGFRQKATGHGGSLDELKGSGSWANFSSGFITNSYLTFGLKNKIPETIRGGAADMHIIESW